LAAWNAIIANELDGTKSGLARILGKFHSNQISVGFKIDTRLDDAESREVFLLKAGGMLMPTEAHYLDDAYSEDRVKCANASRRTQPSFPYVFAAGTFLSEPKCCRLRATATLYISCRWRTTWSTGSRRSTTAKRHPRAYAAVLAAVH
jgi:hypothetical protein